MNLSLAFILGVFVTSTAVAYEFTYPISFKNWPSFDLGKSDYSAKRRESYGTNPFLTFLLGFFASSYINKNDDWQRKTENKTPEKTASEPPPAMTTTTTTTTTTTPPAKTLPPPNPCDPNPCTNDATCYANIADFKYYCACKNNFVGVNCDTPKTDACASSNCVNGACRAYADATGYACECTAGFEGKFCDKPIVIDYCENNPCMYEGQCINNKDNTDYVCVCKYPTSGKNCEKEAGACCDCTFTELFFGQVIFAYESETVSWSEAKKKCEDKGQTLYGLRGLSNFNKVQELLKKMHFRNANKDAYWIGISRKTASEPFLFENDNTFDLVKTTEDHPEQISPKTDGNCAALARIDGSQEFQIAFFDCNITPAEAWSYYYVCEEHFSFLYTG